MKSISEVVEDWKRQRSCDSTVLIDQLEKQLKAETIIIIVIIIVIIIAMIVIVTSSNTYYI